MSDDRVLLGVRIPPELKELVDADLRNNQDVVEASLWQEYENQTKSVVERRIDEKKRRISILESERNERDRELGQERNELASLESKLEAAQSKKERIAREFCETVSEDVSLSPESPAVQNWAEKADMDPSDFASIVREVRR